MELFVIALTVAFICRDPAGTLKAAAAYRRAQAERDKARGGGRRSGSRAMRRYLGTVWQAQWERAIDRYPERMRAAQQRRAARQARRAATREQVQEWAGHRWDERFPAQEEPEQGRSARERDRDAQRFHQQLEEELEREREGERLEEENHRRTAPVVDLGEERRRRLSAVPDPQESAEPEADTDAATTAEEKKENQPMPLNLSDATSLRAHLAALREHADYWDRTCTSKEQLAAGMTSAGVGQSTVAAVDASRAAYAHAAAQARAAADALEEANMAVAEARAGSPDAADGDYYERR